VTQKTGEMSEDLPEQSINPCHGVFWAIIIFTINKQNIYIDD